MSGKNKSYNSIIFLTTLSVYLGLVLVSGAAGGLSSAALTKSFDLKNEIEFKDEFDNNPDKDFPALLAELIEEIREKEISGEIKSLFSKDFSLVNSVQKSPQGSGGGSFVSVLSDETLNALLNQAVYEKFTPLALKFADAENDFKKAKVVSRLNADELLLETSFSKTNSENFAEFLENRFSGSSKEIKNAKVEFFYENTEISAKGNQVFIVTRLPRASIEESLLKL